MQIPNQRMICDFCNAKVDVVRRIALDREYVRLPERHMSKYACSRCSSEKELQRPNREAEDALSGHFPGDSS